MYGQGNRAERHVDTSRGPYTRGPFGARAKVLCLRPVGSPDGTLDRHRAVGDVHVASMRVLPERHVRERYPLRYVEWDVRGLRRHRAADMPVSGAEGDPNDPVTPLAKVKVAPDRSALGAEVRHTLTFFRQRENSSERLDGRAERARVHGLN